MCQLITIPGPNNLFLFLNPSDPKDPALVYGGRPCVDGEKRISSSYWVVMDYGVVEGYLRLTPDQLDFLQRFQNEVKATENKAWGNLE